MASHIPGAILFHFFQALFLKRSVLVTIRVSNFQSRITLQEKVNYRALRSMLRLLNKMYKVISFKTLRLRTISKSKSLNQISKLKNRYFLGIG